MSGRVKDAASKGLLSKQLGGLTQDVAFLDQATGVFKCKKPKKEKTPEQEAMAEIKKLEKKFLNTVYNLSFTNVYVSNALFPWANPIPYKSI